MVETMITLFGEEEQEFSTNGLGSLLDAVSCIVYEERNGEFELTMEYPITGIHFSDLALRRIIFCKSNPYSERQAFRIYDISKPMSGIVTISAHHISYDLSGYPVHPFDAKGIRNAFLMLKKSSVVNHPFSFETDLDEDSAQYSFKTPISTRSALGGVEGSILDVYSVFRGAEYEWDNFKVKLHKKRGIDRGVYIRYGKNLTDIEEWSSCLNLYTGVYPYWYHEDEDGAIFVELPERIINVGETYSFDRILPLDLTSEFEEKPTVDELRTTTKNLIKGMEIGKPSVSFRVSFVRLSKSEEYKEFGALEKVQLCDTVHIELPTLGIDVASKCISTKYDGLADEYLDVEVGDPKVTLSDTISGLL